MNTHYDEARQIADAAGAVALPSYQGSATDIAYLRDYVIAAASAYYGVSPSVFDEATVLSTSLLRDFVHRAGLRAGEPYYWDLETAGDATVPYDQDVAAMLRWPATGYCAFFAHQLFEVYRALGYDATLIDCINGEFGTSGEGASYDQSHSTTEVYVPELGKSIVQDATVNSVLSDDQGYLSFYEARADLAEGKTVTFESFDVYYYYFSGTASDLSLPGWAGDDILDAVGGVPIGWLTTRAPSDYAGSENLFPPSTWTAAHSGSPAPGTTFADADEAANAIAQLRDSGETWQSTGAILRGDGHYAGGFAFVGDDGSIASDWLTVRLADGQYLSVEFDTGEILSGSFDQLVLEATGKAAGSTPGHDMSDFLLPVIVLGSDGVLHADWRADDFSSAWWVSGPIYTTVSYALAQGSQVSLLAAADPSSQTAINLTGSDADNQLYGNAGSNQLIGGRGADSMHGLGGDDFYSVDDVGDAVYEDAGGGFDRVYSSVSYTLASGSQVEILAAADAASTAPLNLSGNEFDNRLYGNAGSNELVGGRGADLMHGLGGDDYYSVDDAGDGVYEDAGGGFDRVYTSVSYALAGGSHVEVLATHDSASTASLNLTGNEFDNQLYGNAGSNQLVGGQGADLLFGLDGDDFYSVDDAGDGAYEQVGGGFDRVYTSVSYALAGGSEVEALATADRASTAALNLTGNEFDNRLFGNAGSNQLAGGRGADAMFGLGGDDFYSVDDAGDRVYEDAGGGYDRVYTSVSYALAGGSQVEVLATDDAAATVPLNLTGNEFDNKIVGNAGSNQLVGGRGADAIYGLGGDDFYSVDDAGDRVYEDAGGGYDRVYTSVNYALPGGSQVEVLAADDAASTLPLNLTGNEFDNRLVGNAGSNQLAGGRGADAMYGLDGDDFYSVDDTGDAVYEAVGGGYDRVYTSVSYALAGGSQVEVLATADAASTAALDLTGNEFDNRIVGNAGTNVIDGGDGADLLFGSAGQDAFAFTTALSASNVDTIADFVVGEDLIYLGAAAGQPFSTLLSGTLAAEAFGIGSTATTAEQHILYDPNSGALYFDADGNGGQTAVQFAVLNAHLSLTNDSFLIV